ncbi:hypothetical protein ACI6PP_10720 [Solicola sp. PLA-1-18]
MFASAATPALTSPFEVRAGTIRPAGGTPVPSSKTDVALWSNGSRASITLKGAGELKIGAIGSYCQDWPILDIRVDGKFWWRTKIVDAKRYGSYTTGGKVLPAGSHDVEITLANDFTANGCDRNAFVSDAWITPSSGSPAPTTPAPTTPAPTKPAPVKPTPTPVKPTPTPVKPTPSKPAPTTPAPTTPAPTTPPASGQGPGPSNTGVPDGTKLTVHQGDLTITQDGAVIDGLDVRGFVDVRADRVTIKNSVIRGGQTGKVNRSLVGAHGGQQGLRIVDTTLVGAYPSPYLDGLKGNNFVADRVDISNVVDTAVIFGSNATIQNSWLHGNKHFSPDPRQPDNKSHDDNVQIEGGSNIRLTNNRLEDANNAAVMVTQNWGRTANVVFSGNILSGGSCTINVSEQAKGPINNLSISSNKFGPSRFQGERCPMRVPRSSKVAVNGNTWVSNGRPALANGF